MPSPKSNADVPVAAADNWSRSRPLMAMEPSVATDIGIAPTRNNQALRKTTRSRSRIAETEVTLLSVASRFMIDSVSTAIRWPPAYSMRTGSAVATAAVRGHPGAGFRFDLCQAIEQTLTERAVERRSCGRGDDQPAAPVGREVSPPARLDGRERPIAGKAIADEREQAQRIRLHELPDFWRGRPQQVPRLGAARRACPAR